MAYTDEQKENDRVLNLVYKQLDNFTNIYSDQGDEINPMPEDPHLTVFCEDDDGGGFVFNVKSSELGITAFCAKKWILHSKLEELIGERISK